MTTYFLTDRKATATMRVDDLLQQHQFYVNPTHHNPMTNQHHQQQAQYSNIGSQNCKLVLTQLFHEENFENEWTLEEESFFEI